MAARAAASALALASSPWAASTASFAGSSNFARSITSCTLSVGPVPTVLVVKSPDELRFDVKGHRCLIYGGKIRELEKLLSAELRSLGLPS